MPNVHTDPPGMYYVVSHRMMASQFDAGITEGGTARVRLVVVGGGAGDAGCGGASNFFFSQFDF